MEVEVLLFNCTALHQPWVSFIRGAVCVTIEDPADFVVQLFVYQVY